MSEITDGLCDSALQTGIISKLLDAFGKADSADRIAVFNKEKGKKVIFARITVRGLTVYISNEKMKTVEDLLDACRAKKSDLKKELLG